MQEPALPKNSYFNQTLAYMYYYDGRIRQMVRSLLRFSQSVDHESVEVTLYMGVACPSPTRTVASICSPER